MKPMLVLDYIDGDLGSSPRQNLVTNLNGYTWSLNCVALDTLGSLFVKEL